jgi:hypothetical protein
MTISNRPFRYALPRAEEFLRVILGNVINNFRNDNQASLSLPPLVRRAYMIVNETGTLPYRDYDAGTKFLGE